MIKKIKKVKTKIKNLLAYSGNRVKLRYALATNKPYLGNIYIANQVWTEREPIMRELISSELRNSKSETFEILEIGTWAGSSAILWANECQRQSKGTILCVDTWQLSPNLRAIEMQKGLKNDAIFKLFLHNLEASGLENYIFPMRCNSNYFAKIVKPESFDFVYIDGDHNYLQFKQDLENFSKTVKPGGIICGDDLELTSQDINIDHARQNCKLDYIKDPDLNKNYHPGIALGILDFFGAVSVKNGFWAMRKSQNNWQQIKL